MVTFHQTAAGGKTSPPRVSDDCSWIHITNTHRIYMLYRTLEVFVGILVFRQRPDRAQESRDSVLGGAENEITVRLIHYLIMGLDHF